MAVAAEAAEAAADLAVEETVVAATTARHRRRPAMSPGAARADTTMLTAARDASLAMFCWAAGALHVLHTVADASMSSSASRATLATCTLARARFSSACHARPTATGATTRAQVAATLATGFITWATRARVAASSPGGWQARSAPSSPSCSVSTNTLPMASALPFATSCGRRHRRRHRSPSCARPAIHKRP